MNNDNSSESIRFYERALIPLLKSKNAEMSIAISELESHILLKNNKIQELEKRVKQLETKNNFYESSIKSEKVNEIIIEDINTSSKKRSKKV
jgi:hypothetical protein